MYFDFIGKGEQERFNENLGKGEFRGKLSRDN